MQALGIDSSNYRSSAALFTAPQLYVSQRELLPVPKGALGLRQSDAVFAQTRQLPTVLSAVLSQAEELCCIGVSDRPRPLEDSYMPCFLVGVGLAQAVQAALKVPLYRFSHQEGHVAAAIVSCGNTALFEQEFLAFHVSGGTTEVLHVSPLNGGFRIQKLGGSLDLHAGQLIDRVGGLLNLPFPAGEALEALAQNGTALKGAKISVNQCNCNLSGMQNYCAALLQKGAAPADVAATLLEFLGRTLLKMARQARAVYNLPVLFSGGVMANAFIRQMLQQQLPAYFATPELSGDNAVGLAALAAAKFKAETVG